MLTIAEELMLLALNEEKGSVVFGASSLLNMNLSFAVLIDLVLNKNIEVEKKAVRILSHDLKNLRNEYFQTAIDLIEEKKKEKDLSYWVQAIGSKMSNINKNICQDLVDKNILEEKEEKFLWIFDNNKYPEKNPKPEIEIRKRIKNVVLKGVKPDERTLLLIVLMKNSNLIEEIFEKSERKEAKKAIKELTSKENLASVFDSASTEIQAALAAVMITVVMVPVFVGSN